MAPIALRALAALSALTAVATAEQGVTPSSGGVTIRVGSVLASNQGAAFDARLATIRDQIGSFFSYSSYRLVDDQQRRIAWGGRAGFDVPGGRHVLVMPREFRNGHVVIKLEVTDGRRSLIDTQVALRDRGTFLLGGQKQPDGQMILAIGAEREE